MADETKEIIISVKTDTSGAGAGIDQLQDKMDGLNDTKLDQPFKTLKTQIKDAVLDAQKLEQQFGKNSDQFVNAAKRVADLKDRFSEFNGTINNFNPDNKLQAFVGATRAAVGTIQGLTAGMNLLGIQSGTAEQAIQKLQAIMAFSDVLNNIDNIKNGFNDMLSVAKNAFKSMSKGDLIGVAIIGITALGVAVYELFVNTRELTEEQKRYNEVTNIAIEKNGAQIASLDILIDRITKGGLTQTEKTRTLKEYNEKLGDTLGKYETYQQLETAMIANGPRYISYLLTKAKAEAAYGLLLQEQQKLLKAEATDAKEFTGFSVFGTLFGFDDEETYKNSKKVATDRIQEGVTTIQNMYTALQSEADKARTDLNITIPEPKKTTSTMVKKNVVEKYETTKTISDLTGSIAGETEQERLNKIVEFRKDFNSQIIELDKDRFLQSEALSQANLKVEENISKSRKELDEIERRGKIEGMYQVSNIASTLSDLAGRQTVAGKALAVASATINTWLGASSALKDNYTAFGPAAPFVRVATVAGVILSGLKQVKEILKVQVPNTAGGSGGGSIPSVADASTAPIINAASTVPQNIQNVRVTNMGTEPIRAYITNRDLQSNEQKNKFLNNVSTF